jgi:hypothetical protein
MFSLSLEISHDLWSTRAILFASGNFSVLKKIREILKSWQTH